MPSLLRVLIVVLCPALWLSAQDQDFVYSVPELEVPYDPDGGALTITIRPTFQQNPATVTYPLIQTQGLSLGLAHDPAVMSLVSVSAGPELQAMNNGAGPDFFAPSMTLSGLTLGVVYSLMGGEVLEVENPTEIVTLEYETMPNVLQGNQTGFDSQLIWSESLSRVPSGPPVENLVVAGGFSSVVLRLNGVIHFVAIPTFLRGDVNGDGRINVSDVVSLLNHLFATGLAPMCMDAADANDSGAVSFPDAVTLLNHIFVFGAPEPAPPFPSCGSDFSPDSFECIFGAVCP